MDANERVAELAHLISQLPVANYSLLRALTAHLILIVQNANVNKMTMRNVGIVFSPTLGIPAGVFSLMLGEFNKVFSVEPEQSEAAAYAEEHLAVANVSPLASKRNSRHYADGAADKMLGLVGRSLEAPSEESDEEVLSEHEESGAETENEVEIVQTVESLSSSDGPSPSSVSTHTPPADTPPAGKVASNYSHNSGARVAKAANVAASRGLQVATDGESRRASGLPVSPRPVGKTTFISGTPTHSTPSTPR